MISYSINTRILKLLDPIENRVSARPLHLEAMYLKVLLQLAMCRLVQSNLSEAIQNDRLIAFNFCCSCIPTYFFAYKYLCRYVVDLCFFKKILPYHG